MSVSVVIRSGFTFNSELEMEFLGGTGAFFGSFVDENIIQRLAEVEFN